MIGLWYVIVVFSGHTHLLSEQRMLYVCSCIFIFMLANNVDIDEVSNSLAFHLDVYCLTKHHIHVSRIIE